MCFWLQETLDMFLAAGNPRYVSGCRKP